MHDRLSRRYRTRDADDHLNYIDSILNRQPTKNADKTQILYKDLVFLDSRQEWMKGYVDSADNCGQLLELASYYRFMKDTPTLYMKWHGKMLSKYNDFKKIISYIKIRGAL